MNHILAAKDEGNYLTILDFSIIFLIWGTKIVILITMIFKGGGTPHTNLYILGDLYPCPKMWP